MIVLDTSVIVKWFIIETDSSQANKILEEYRLGNISISEPDIFVYEFTNVLRYNKSLSVEEKLMFLNFLFNLDLHIFNPYHSLMKETLKLAEKYNIAIYDANFITLAIELKSNFITADDKLYKKINKIPQVILLKDYVLN